MAKITFKEYLDCYDKEIVVASFIGNAPKSPLIKPITVKSAEEKRKIDDVLEFYYTSARLVDEYPKCRDMIIAGVERFERTGVKFQVCYNFYEYPDSEVPDGFVPIVLYFPGN